MEPENQRLVGNYVDQLLAYQASAAMDVRLDEAAELGAKVDAMNAGLGLDGDDIEQLHADLCRIVGTELAQDFMRAFAKARGGLNDAPLGKLLGNAQLSNDELAALNVIRADYDGIFDQIRENGKE